MSRMTDRAAKAILAKVPAGYGMTPAEALMYARAVMEEMLHPPPEIFDGFASDIDGRGTAEAVWEDALEACLK